ncbi:MAG: ABC transporter permease [Deltaproteobacteria bacterium]|nr:MAG: ABC transporter permease [Deltaproteobacteria bacterium]
MFVAGRIVRSRRSPTLSLVTLISVFGIAFGVMALSVVLSVTAGFEHTFQDRILGLYPHLVVTPESSRFEDYDPVLAKIRATPGVAGATPITSDSMMVANGVFRAGASIEGVDPATVGSVIQIERLMKDGGLDALAEEPALDVPASGDPVTLTGAVEGTWSTLVLTDGAPPRIAFDERVVPDAGHARIKLLDLRKAPSTEVRLSARGGPAVERFDAVETVALTVAAPEGGVYGRERELLAGDWDLFPTGERIEVAADTHVTVVILDGADGKPEARLMIEPGATRTTDNVAHLRVVDGRTRGPEVRIEARRRSEDPATRVAAVSPGEFTEFEPIPARLPGILLGKALAEKLDAKVGDDLTLVTPLRGIDNKMMGPFGMLPSSSHFRVAGVFESGFHDHDAKLAMINLRVGQRFLNRGRIIHSIAVRSTDLIRVDDTRGAIARAIDPFPLDVLIDHTESLREKFATLVQPGFSPHRMNNDTTFVGGLRNFAEAVNLLKFQKSDFARRARFRIYDWKEKNRFMFGALELQKVVLSMFFLIIILVGSFVVVGSQTMVIHEKTADIAILKAMGATDNVVRLVFTLQGLFVALAGALVGLVLGLGLIWVIDAVDYKLDASIYLIDHLPARVDPAEIVLVVLGSLLCTLLTTQISAGRAAAKTVVEGLRAVD